MAATQWETCSADALLREFFAQDDLSRLAEGAGALLGCPLLVLDDTFLASPARLDMVSRLERLVYLAGQDCMCEKYVSGVKVWDAIEDR